MAIGTTTISVTPCCGAIQRTWECLPNETGYTHTPGELGGASLQGMRSHTISSGPYAPTFTREQTQLSRGICPDCGQSFEAWLEGHGRIIPGAGWRWDYSAAERAYARKEATRRLAGRLEELLGES